MPIVRDDYLKPDQGRVELITHNGAQMYARPWAGSQYVFMVGFLDQDEHFKDVPVWDQAACLDAAEFFKRLAEILRDR